MSSKNNNKLNIPEARAAMDKFKMEAASEVGVNLKEGYNGDLTSREAGSVGGQMVTDDTILPKAPPIMIPTAMSITLPRMANCLNSCRIFFII